MSEDSLEQVAQSTLSTFLPGEDGRHTPRPRITKPLALEEDAHASPAPRSRITRPLPPVEQAEQETLSVEPDAPIIPVSAGQESVQDETGEEHEIPPPADTMAAQSLASALLATPDTSPSPADEIAPASPLIAPAADEIAPASPLIAPAADEIAPASPLIAPAADEMMPAEPHSATPVAQESLEVPRRPTAPLLPTQPEPHTDPPLPARPPIAPPRPRQAPPVQPARPRQGQLSAPPPLPAPVPLYPHIRSLSIARQRRLKRIYRLQYFSRKHLRRARANDRRARRHLWTAIWSTSSTLLLLLLALASIIGSIAYNFINTTQGTYASQVLTLRDLLPPDNLKIYDSQNRLIDQLTDQGIHTEVPYDQIAPDLVNATVAIEDRTFWQNQGVDITGILRSALTDLENGQPVEGGSTITQQLIKLLIVRNSSDIVRKLSEIVLAPQVNDHYSKRDIMEMYLNTIYYGHQAYGIDAAATVYFGLEDKPGHSAASQLDLAQAAMLAGLPRNASLYDPFAHPQTSFTRFYSVLEAMVAQGSISQLQAQAAYQEGQSPHFFKSSPTLQDQAPHFDDYILTQLEQIFHLTRAQLSRSGLIVYTTLDVVLQQKILKVMQQHIAEIRAAHHVTNAAEVLIDFHTGAIISMLGSIDYYDNSIDGQFNAALGYRQPGSSFKPYVYVTAFEQGASPAQAVDDAPTTFSTPGSNPPTYSPGNYDNRFHGHMTLRCALQNSLNVPAVRVLQHVGVNNAMATAQAMGITSYEGTVGLSMVLGGLDVRLLDHTSAMGVFANGGVRQPYYSISKVVQGTTGTILYQHTLTPGTQVITPQLAYMMTSVLSDNTSRLPEFFDCNVLQLYANSQQDCYNGNRGPVRPAAAKTGTTQNFRDNWTIGYTTDFVMGVWAGNDDNSPMIDVTGVQGAAPIWHDAMLLAEQGHPIQDFQNPGGLVRATVTYPDGVTSTDWFLPGTVPNGGTTTPTPTPTPGPQGPTPTPYCSNYSFAFAPPPGDGIPANGAWW
jgi:membrane peptidoglycan carboxypeptidase